ncbi:hypothetical protein Tco_1338576 [Tanacetum coccineum]
MVLEVEETDFASPIRGADMENVGVKDVGNSVHDDSYHNFQQMYVNCTPLELDKPVADVNGSGDEEGGCEEGWSSTPAGIQSMDSHTHMDSLVADANVLDDDANGCGEVRSPKSNVSWSMGSIIADSTKVVDEGASVDTNTSDIGDPKGSFASILNPNPMTSKKLNFRTLVNDERVENSDFVLPKSAIDNVKNRYIN